MKNNIFKKYSNPSLCFLFLIISSGNLLSDDGTTDHELSFAPPITVSPNGTDGAASTEAGDFDNDGDFEVISAATTSTSDAHFRIYNYNGSGFDVINILPDSEVENRRDRFGGDLTTADINEDGWTDIIVPSSSNGNGGGTLSWFENPDGNLNGVWTEHVISTWSGSGDGEVAHMSEVDVGDINGDGKLDVITRDISHGVYILLQETDGSGWQTRRFIPTRSREGLDLFNPDNDNDLDIILNGVWLETPDNILTGNFIEHTYGAAWYPSGTTNNEIRDYAAQLAIRDFNGDGRDDILISNSEELSNATSTASKPQGIQLYLAPLDPKTQAWTQVIIETDHFSWHSLEPADLDCDGDMDFMSAISSVGADNAAPEINYFLNNGDGTAFTKVVFSNSSFLYNSTLADVDGDGDHDLFAPQNFNSGGILYFKNTFGPPPPVIEDPELNDFLVAHWPLDEQAGSTASEITGNYSGSLTNNPLWLAQGGLNGGALQMNGNNDRVETNAIPISGDAITLSTWIKPASFAGTAAEARFISKASGTNANDHDWMIGNIGDGSALRFRLKTGNTTTTLTGPTGSLTIGEWAHVAATYDGLQMRLYLNGSQIASTAKTGTITNTANTNVGIGNQPTGAGDRGLNGCIDDPRIYNLALSQQQLTLIMTPSLLDVWANSFGLPSNLSIDSDSDNDSTGLLIEYSLGLNPNTRDTPPISLEISGNAATFSYPQIREELNYQVEQSINLNTWETDGINQGNSPTGTINTAIIPISDEKNKNFIRLRVTR